MSFHLYAQTFKIEPLSFAVDFSQRLRKCRKLGALAQNPLAKAISVGINLSVS